MPNIVYVLTNPAMPDLVKIGLTTNLTERLRSLSSSGVPAPFEVYYACEIRDDLSLLSVERDMHFIFAPYRFNPNREFFRVDPERVKVALHYAAKQGSETEVNPADYDQEFKKEVTGLNNNSSKARARFTFSELDIPIGSVLHFYRDSSITAVVHDDTHILFNGDITTLSGAANDLMKEKFGWTCRPNGPKKWRYEDELLSERRIRLEEINQTEED